jgi:hypothetical protein
VSQDHLRNQALGNQMIKALSALELQLRNRTREKYVLFSETSLDGDHLKTTCRLGCRKR